MPYRWNLSGNHRDDLRAIDAMSARWRGGPAGRVVLCTRDPMLDFHAGWNIWACPTRK